MTTKQLKSYLTKKYKTTNNKTTQAKIVALLDMFKDKVNKNSILSLFGNAK